MFNPTYGLNKRSITAIAMRKSCFIFLLVLANCALAQSEKQLEKLFDKKWKITSYEISGQPISENDAEKSDYILFFSDHKMTSVSHSLTQNSKWEYDSLKNNLTIYSEDVETKTVVLILKITDFEFVGETINPEGMTITLFMESGSNNNR